MQRGLGDEQPSEEREVSEEESEGGGGERGGQRAFPMLSLLPEASPDSSP